LTIFRRQNVLDAYTMVGQLCTAFSLFLGLKVALVFKNLGGGKEEKRSPILSRVNTRDSPKRRAEKIIVECLTGTPGSTIPREASCLEMARSGWEYI
jgi:hypothetical protein